MLSGIRDQRADRLLVLAGLGAFALALAFDVGVIVLSWDLIMAAINAAL